MAEKKKVKEEVVVPEKVLPNITGNYNHDNEGVITEEFLNQVIKSSGNQSKYLTVKGMFNLQKQGMTLQQVLNFMYSKDYKFSQFISNDRNIQGEMIFEHV